MTNFDSNKVIIFHYDTGAGGRFLANNLSLSSDCVMMNAKLAMMQLDGKLNQKQKLSVLLSALNKTLDHWIDLGFNDREWIGIDYTTMPEKLKVIDYYYLDECELKTKVYTNKDFQYLTVNNTKYLFLTSHSPEELDKLLSVWKNAKVISLKNENLFKHIRRFEHSDAYNYQAKLKTVWKLILKKETVDFMDVPMYFGSPDGRHFDMLPESIKSIAMKYLSDSEFLKKVNEMTKIKYSSPVPKLFSEYSNLTEKEKSILEKENLTEEYVHPNSVFVWDCNWYLSEQNTIHNIKYLYDVLELEGYDEQSTRSYYRSWIKKLEELI